MGARVVGAVAVLCLVGTACGHRRDAVTTAGDDEPPPTAASPFLVDGVPDGFRLEVAGRGTTSQEWGGDSYGSDEPFTVLAPPGADPGGPEAVIVSVTGYAGYEGGFDQASGGYGSDSMDHFRVDGHPAIYAPAAANGYERGWEDLVVARGDDLAVRVTAVGAGRDRLVEIARGVEPDEDTARGPHVPDPPDGLEVVGSVGVGVELALTASFDNATYVPGMADAYAAGWVTQDAPHVPEASSRPGPGGSGRGGVAATRAPAAPAPLDHPGRLPGRHRRPHRRARAPARLPA